MPSSQRFLTRTIVLTLAAAALIALVVVFDFARGRRQALPAAGSQAYEQVTRVFYRGLAALEVGLIDNAKQEFTRATQLAAEEPAVWADLALAHLRLGELDQAADPIGRAVSLAPRNAEVALLAGRMEIARGRIDAGIAQLRRAVELDANELRARYALAQEVERSGSADADAEALRLLDDLMMRASENLAVLLDRARVAAKRGDAGRLADSVARLQRFAEAWPTAARQQFAALQTAAASGDFMAAARATALLRNVLAPVPVYRESLAAIATPPELIAEPFDRFVAMPTPVATPAPADVSTTFSVDLLPNAQPAGRFVAVPLNGTDPPALFSVDQSALRRLDGARGEWPFPGRAGAGPGDSITLLPIDWNHDFRTDLVLAGHGGLRLLLQQTDGGFADGTADAAARVPFTCDCRGAWAADVEMDGDVDIVVGVNGGATVVLRNNGDGTWQPLTTFASVPDALDFAWADLDGDGDPDAALLQSPATLRTFVNHQAGAFTEAASMARVEAFTVGDPHGDGLLDLVTLSEETESCQGACGVIRRSGPGRPTSQIARATGVVGGSHAPGSYRLLMADVDNNGATDIIAAGIVTTVWLAGEDRRFEQLPIDIKARVDSIADLDGDGRLDLTGVIGGQPARLLGRGEKKYHWKTIRARAQQNAGDQRINSFGVGGDIEIRSGLLAQKQVLIGAPAHFGLGTQTSIDVARILWPNGVPQAEFDARVDDTIVAEQRLKGSCPWVFAYDGERMAFVTDFLWRSPLGLRINAQDTAGIGQTEDWIRIRGDQLVPRNGSYDVRITAELWETHFFDLVSLLVVDHPADSEVFVDERFSATRPPALAVQAMRNIKPVTRASDDAGRDVTELVAQRDGRYVAGFERAAYQGIAKEHYVELELGADVRRDGRLTLLASGWVYPTDSSINVAIGQNGRVRPRGVALEAQDAHGAWTVVEPDLGFPAGKNKTIVIDLSGARGALRIRLRTNLEIYWDWLAVAEATDAPLTMTRIAAGSAELRYRGYSQTTSPRGEAPETPEYARLANTTPRWRDLSGYYTRFGDVGELLDRVDDRYVIMNAGDELRLQYPAPPGPVAGQRRDFVLIGDGWEKDGDYNTGYSSTVLPLPTHARTTYESASSSLELEDDPVYRRHREDWDRYHTRYVTADWFLRGLRY